MGSPQNRRDQTLGKITAFLSRGAGGFPLQPHEVELEPPWETFDPEVITRYDRYALQWTHDLAGQFIPNQPVILRQHDSPDDLKSLWIEPYAGDDDQLWRAKDFLTSLHLSYPLAFELIGEGEKIRACFTARTTDAHQVDASLASYYPNAALRVTEPWLPPYGAPGYYLLPSAGYVFPLAEIKFLNSDPLQSAVSALENLPSGQWGCLQVLFAPCTNPWKDVPRPNREDLQSGLELYPDTFRELSQLTDALLRDKFSSPLYSVSIRVASADRRVLDGLLGWSNHFAHSPQTLRYLHDPNGTRQADAVNHDLASRVTHRVGTVLNRTELAGLVHVPAHSVSSEKLARVKGITRPAPQFVPGLVLGTNEHRGKQVPVVIPDEKDLRFRHFYAIGGSGGGKSTLLLNMIMQDIAAGEGLCVIDPHGELIEKVLKRVMPHRVDDVILLDAGDDEYPVAMNVLQTHNPRERKLIVYEIAGVMERYFGSWGDRMQHILVHALATLARVKGGSLDQVERLLQDEAFRTSIVSSLSHPKLLRFWNNYFASQAQSVVAPILNKMSPLVGVEQELTQNIIGQPDCLLDFKELVRRRQILLVNLPPSIGESAQAILGTFVVTRFRSAVFQQANKSRFFMYIDEFQNFATMATMRFDLILAQARKFGLGLYLANQATTQIPPLVATALNTNVGTMVSFRLGDEEAYPTARQFAGFEAEQLMNLTVGEALGRLEVRSQSFNFRTMPDPPLAVTDPTAYIRQRSRKLYARPREEVERYLEAFGSPAQPAPQPLPTSTMPQPSPGQPKKRASKKKKPKDPMESGDGSLEDFIS